MSSNTLDGIEFIPITKFPKNGKYRAIEAWLEEESLTYNYPDRMITDEEEKDLMNLENDILEEVFSNDI